MSYRLRIRLAAEADVAEAAQWYNERQLGLGEKFIREVDPPGAENGRRQVT